MSKLRDEAEEQIAFAESYKHVMSLDIRQTKRVLILLDALDEVRRASHDEPSLTAKVCIERAYRKAIKQAEEV